VTAGGVELVVVADERQAAVQAAQRLAEAAGAGGNVVLTGGRTPELAYRRVAEIVHDWRRVDLWWSDERCVGPDDENSNYALTRAALLDHVEHDPAHVHRIKGELGKERAAAEYEQELGDVALDFALLGIGPDGHVASLFPNAPTLQRRERVLPAEAGLEPFIDRVTLSLPTLCATGEILFLVTGEDKATAVRRAFAEAPDPSTPSSLVRAASGTTIALLDRAAAAQIQT